MRDFEGKIALVTGGSRGIGRAICCELSQRAATVVMSYASNEAAATQTVKCIEDAGGKVKAMRFDVSNSSECSRAIETIIQEYGRLDVLINNAGVSIDGLLMRMKDEQWDKVIDTNLKAVFALMRAASKPMMKQKYGAIVSLSSVVGEMGNAGQAAYAASKAGIIGLTKSAALELASRNIRVNCVTPGFITTDMTAHLDNQLQEKMTARIPLSRIGNAREVAAAVAFLASDAASYITGEVLKVNGGMYM